MVMPRHTIRLLLVLCITVVLTQACGKKRTSASTPRNAPARTAATKSSRPVKPPAKPGTTEVGMASWYGEPYHGRRAANGEVYDMNKMTAAHRTLPFDTLVEVLNLDNQQDVKVRITDRGPFIDGRIIDLSREAAKQISMLGPGTAKVRVKVLGVQRREEMPAPKAAPVAAPPAAIPAAPTAIPSEKSSPAPAAEPCAPSNPAGGEAPRPGGGYAVQIGAFREAKQAEKLQRRMASRYGNAYIENVRSDQGMLYRVRVGPRSSLAEASQLAASLQRENFQSLVVRVDSRIKD